KGSHRGTEITEITESLAVVFVWRRIFNARVAREGRKERKVRGHLEAGRACQVLIGARSAPVLLATLAPSLAILALKREAQRRRPQVHLCVLCVSVRNPVRATSLSLQGES